MNWQMFVTPKIGFLEEMEAFCFLGTPVACCKSEQLQWQWQVQLQVQWQWQWQWQLQWQWQV